MFGCWYQPSSWPVAPRSKPIALQMSARLVVEPAAELADVVPVVDLSEVIVEPAAELCPARPSLEEAGNAGPCSLGTSGQPSACRESSSTALFHMLGLFGMPRGIDKSSLATWSQIHSREQRRGRSHFLQPQLEQNCVPQEDQNCVPARPLLRTSGPCGHTA